METSTESPDRVPNPKETEEQPPSYENATTTPPPIKSRNPFSRFVAWTDDKIWRFLPARTYCRLPRAVFFLLICAVIIIILLLVIILPSVLLTRKKSSSVPLPTGNGTFVGDGTYYEPGLGACGITSSDSDMIVAISHTLFDAMGSKGASDPNANPACGRHIVAGLDNGSTKGIRVEVVDRCVGCKPTDLDFSPHAFDQLANEDLGRIKIKWAWDD